jgi:hypothetical protein
MNHKVFRSVFVIAVTLALTAVMVRIQDAPKAPLSAVKAAAPDTMSRVMASYRVREEIADRGMDYVGANYKARVAETGVAFGPVPEVGALYASREFTVELGTPRIEQGSLQLECQGGRFARAAHGVAQIHRGAVTEEYVFENNRIEQLFRFPTSLGSGALRVAVPVKTDLGGPVVVHSPQEEGFKDFRFRKGGLEFQDRLGELKLAVHGAVVIDAEGRQLALAPRHERSEIVLEVPAAFMAEATYPVVIDPWFDLNVGLAGNFRAGEKPAIARHGSGSFWAGPIAWSDSSTGNFEIYVARFNEVDMVPYGISLSPGGISGNAGRSVNPSIVMDSNAQPIVAWEDDSGLQRAIYVKRWNAKNKSWEEMAGSATDVGISGNGGGNAHPSVGVMQAIVPGAVTFDDNGNPISTQGSRPEIPVVAWDGVGGVYCSAFYPGAPALPPNPAVPNSARVAVPAGWYQFGTVNGALLDPTKFNASIVVSGGRFPSLVVDSLNQPAIAFEGVSGASIDILVARWASSTPGADFQIMTEAGNASFGIQPSGNFGIVNASGTATALSQYPSMAVDGTSLTVAWQETEPTQSQIYVARSVGGAAFGLIGLNPGFPGGMSDSPGMASTPSLDVSGGSIGVAWADTSNGRSSIYIRRLSTGNLGAQWEQIGFQGSAFPPAFVGEVAPIAGVSQSPNFAIQPALSMGSGPSVIWADGALGVFNIKGKTFEHYSPGFASGIGTTNPTFTVQVQQSSTDPATAITPIAPGGFSTGTSVWFVARIFTENPPFPTLRLEIEIQPAGVAFTGTPNVPQTQPIVPDDPAFPALGNLAVIQFDGLPNANYHWRARAADDFLGSSFWVSPGEQNGVSFRINDTANTGGGSGPPNVTPVASASTPSKGSCGLTGLEAVALLGLASLLRRSRRK